MRLLSFLLTQEAQEAGERALDGFKQRVFASAFGSFNQNAAMKQYYEAFEKQPDEVPEYDIKEYEPETDADIQRMLNSARRAGAIS